jgi:Pyrimidine reductase, riboflavin biosynthesis
MCVMRLHPLPPKRLPLSGLYLGQQLHRAGTGKVTIYANFIASVDGRIALPAADDEFAVPAHIANARDWRLYQELAAQADVMLTSGRYCRQLTAGRAQDLLPIGPEPEYRDLRDWRKARGLSPQPHVAILSAGLDIPTSVFSRLRDRRVYVVTTTRADRKRQETLVAHGARILHAGEGSHVDGRILHRRLAELGFRSVYAVAGPQVLATLLAASVLDRLFLTLHGSLLGGGRFHTLLQSELEDPVRLMLRSLYLDRDGGNEQLFAQFVPVYPSSSRTVE